MKALFGSQELWELVTDGYVEPTSEQEVTYNADQKNLLKDQRKKDKKELFLLRKLPKQSQAKKHGRFLAFSSRVSIVWKEFVCKLSVSSLKLFTLRESISYQRLYWFNQLNDIFRYWSISVYHFEFTVIFYIYKYMCVCVLINIKVYYRKLPQFKTNYSWF